MSMFCPRRRARWLVATVTLALLGGLLWICSSFRMVRSLPVAYRAHPLKFLRLALGHIHYDKSNNVVNVSPWSDMNLETSGAASTDGDRALAGMALRVTDAATARLFIGGREHSCLAREFGPRRDQVVQVVDDSEPVIVYDEVDLYQKNGDVTLANADGYFGAADAYRGKYCLELHLKKPVGHMAWTFPGKELAGMGFVRFAYRKSNPLSSLTVAFVTETGEHWSLSEGADFPRSADDRWHEIVVPIPARAKGDRSRLSEFVVNGLGDAEDHFYLDCLHLLPEALSPKKSEDSWLVAGTSSEPRDGLKVTLALQAWTEETYTKAGRFAFSSRVRTGDVFTVYCQAPNGAKHYPTAGRLLEADPSVASLVISLNDLRERCCDKNGKRSHVCPQMLDVSLGPCYQPKSFFEHGGIGEPREFQNRLQVNNLGFLDRDRRTANPHGADRILMMGSCDLFGHSVPRRQHANIVLEGLLALRTGRNFEVMTLADMNTNFGRLWSYYDKLGRGFRPRVVAMTLLNGSVLVESDPELYARCHEFDPSHLPYPMLRSRPDGTLEQVAADPEFLVFSGKDPKLHEQHEQYRRQGKHRYVDDGIDWIAALHREDDDLPPRVRAAFEHFERIVRFYDREIRKDGAEFVILFQPLLGMQQYADLEEWTDDHGVRYRKDKYAERIHAMLNRAGVRFIDMTDFAAGYTSDPSIYFWKRDRHPSAYGFQMIAEALAAYLETGNMLQRGPAIGPSVNP